jgi:hypothetical protein
MRYARPAAFALIALAFAAPAAATTRAVPTLPAAPQQVHAFLLRTDEPLSHSFARTPSFAWLPVAGAERYEFELATSPTFNDGSIVWSDTSLRTPAASIPYSLPWMTGSPYALYAHVRAWTRDGAGQWSTPFGLNMRWSTQPAPVPTYPGLVSWSTVPGATSYDVWFTDPNKVISTRSNVADEREYFDFHQQPSWTAIVHWRVRAVRNLYGSTAGLPSGLPAVTYGPWSKVYTSANPPSAGGPLKLIAAFSDVTSSAAQPEAHRLTPGFAFSGNQALDGTVSEVYRAYVFTDSDCVNVVFRGAIVGSPAYAPRTTGPVQLPTSTALIANARTAFLPDGPEPTSFMADTAQVEPTEMDKPSAAPATDSQSPAAPPSGDSSPAATPSTPAATTTTTPPAGDPSQTPLPSNSLPTTPKVNGAPVELWDSGWPNGRYYWTVVPVKEVNVPALTTALTSAAAAGATTITVASAAGFTIGATILIGSGVSQESVAVLDVLGSTLTLSRGLARAHPAADIVVNPSPGIEYVDAELPQDACAAGRVATFGKVSEPVLAGSTSPFASGLSPNGRLIAAVSAQPTFYGTPLVAWQPAVGADEYQVQWSKAKYPWTPVGQRNTFSTSALLDQVVSGKRVGLTPGVWYYRVRGLDFLLPGTARAMSWSDPVGFAVAKPTFKVVGSVSAPTPKAKATPTKTPAAMKSFSSAADGFSLSYPLTWQQQTVPATSSTRFAARDSKLVEGLHPDVVVYQGPPRGSLSDSAWLNALVVDTASTPGLVGKPTAAWVTSPAGRAVLLKTSEQTTKGTIAVWQYVFDTQGKSLSVAFGAPPSAFGTYTPTFNQILATFKLSP